MKIALCAAALLVTQAAIAEEVVQKPAAEEPKQICTREKPVGSNRPIRVCRDAEAVEIVGERSREAFEVVLRNRFNPPELRP
ncbi:hypothetical protein [Luteimonas deserti]|uniref:Uncharacterized protein n=1 Tax=Luteimonas deserti TaxID=2752306 RepID=A0A7Z0TV44_9GAMM|nr:hypothetical protein [Luteimonas deserti]NYZ61864.1 hypothetical protein [Luteimonas deserti]